ERRLGGFVIARHRLLHGGGVGAAENDILFADRCAVEIAFRLKRQLGPGGISIDQHSGGRRQAFHSKRGVENNNRRHQSDDGSWRGYLPKDIYIIEFIQNLSPLRRNGDELASI